mmetsp:Transcript_29506/g.83224  ORF Transcript_29506/g.83224 Transcript_29506/m.83224 type:complete len:240 (+) Transcript_29506:403-1122(+)
MVPSAWCTSSLQSRAQGCAHADDPFRHLLHLSIPLLLQGRVAQHLGHNQSSMQRRVGVCWAGNSLQLALNRGSLLGVVTHNGKASDALAVETHVLGIALAQAHVMAILQEDLNCLPVPHAVSTGKALVGHVKEGKVVLLKHELADLSPLAGSWVNARRIVCTGVQQKDAAVRCSLDILHHPLKIQATRLWLVVPVCGLVASCIPPDVVVVCPGWDGDVHLGVWQVPFLEICQKPAGSSS